MSAQNQVFSIPEIVENILLQLPILDLLINAPLVSHAWHEAIKAPLLQQALFFLPIPPSTSQTPTFNPLLQSSFNPWFSSTQKDNLYNRGAEFTTLPWNKKREAYSRPQASWRKMLPVQPPPTVFSVDARTSARGGPSRRVGKVEFPEGVNMGVLYDYAQTAVSWPISSFWVEWKMFELMEEDSVAGRVASRVWKPSNVVVMHTRHTVQCRIGGKPDVAAGYRSLGYEELEFEFSNASVRRDDW